MRKLRRASKEHVALPYVHALAVGCKGDRVGSDDRIAVCAHLVQLEVDARILVFDVGKRIRADPVVVSLHGEIGPIEHIDEFDELRFG